MEARRVHAALGPARAGGPWDRVAIGGAAAGNVVDPRAHVIAAAGAACTAAIAMSAWLLERDLSALSDGGRLQDPSIR